MKTKDVIISVTGMQTGSGPEPMELVTAGKYNVGPDVISMSWEESELTGMEGTKTEVTVLPGSVVLERKGTLNSRMEFQEGKKNFFLYETPFGSATMGLNTNRIQANLGSHGGELLVDFSLDVEHKGVGRNRVYIKVEEPKQSHTGDIKWPI